jgi:hypothetical protein
MNDPLQVYLEALRGSLQNLEETIRRLLQLMQTLPRSNLRNQLLEEVSALDSMADTNPQALDSQPKSTSKGPEQWTETSGTFNTSL